MEMRKEINVSAGIVDNIAINSLKHAYQTFFLGNSCCPYIFLIKVSSFLYLKCKTNNWQRILNHLILPSEVYVPFYINRKKISDWVEYLVIN